MEEIKEYMKKKLGTYSSVRTICILAFVLSGGLAIFIQSFLMKFIFATFAYLLFFSLTIIIDKKYSLYKITTVLIDTPNIYFRRYLEKLKDEASLEEYDMPLFGLHASIHREEMKYRSLISLLTVLFFGVTGLLLSIIFDSIAFFIMLVGPGGCFAMYVDAALFVKSLKQSYAKFFCDEMEKRSNGAKTFTAEERKLAEDMALVYSWKNTDNGHDGVNSVKDWTETKEHGHLPRIPALLREIAISAHKREFESNLTISLSITFAGWILTVLFPLLYDVLPGFRDFLGLGDISDSFLSLIMIIGIVTPMLYYFFNMTSVLGKKLEMPDISRRVSLYERFVILKYIAYFYPLRDEDGTLILPELISSLEKQHIITEIDFARSIYDYALGCSLGLYKDQHMFFSKPILIDEIPDDWSKLTYADQYITQKQKGTIDILLATLSLICIPWLFGSPIGAVIILLSGLTIFILYETVLYKLILPIPSLNKMRKKIKKLKDAGIIE